MRKWLFYILIMGFFKTGFCTVDDQINRETATHVFIVSEWLPKENCDEKLWNFFKELMAMTKANEPGCIRAHATRQIAHPGSPGTSKYTIVLLQEYVNVEAFDAHCASEYVQNAFKTYAENEETSLVEDWTCRLFHE